MKGLSPTQRTLAALRDRGMVCGIVERFNRHAGPFGIRQDFLGFLDVIGCEPGRGIVGIQCCAGSGFAAHMATITEARAEECIAWLKCGGKVELWAWRKVKLKRGGKAEVWQPRVREIVLSDFVEGE